MVQLSAFDITVAVSVLQDVIKTKRLGVSPGITHATVPSTLSNESGSIFYNISSVLNKIIPKILCFVFLWTPKQYLPPSVTLTLHSVDMKLICK